MMKDSKVKSMRRSIKIGIWSLVAIVIVYVVSMLIFNRSIDNNNKGTIRSFLGKSIVMNDLICEQISTIADQDTLLSYMDSIIQIGDVKWRINIMPNGVALMTSVQPNDPKMKQVVTYLNRIYGKPYDDEEDGFSIKWSSSDDSLDIFRPGSTLIHLRRVHTEEGGTFLLFN